MPLSPPLPAIALLEILIEGCLEDILHAQTAVVGLGAQLPIMVLPRNLSDNYLLI